MAIARLTGSTSTTTTVPTGAIMPFAVATLPYAWLACDGMAVDRTAYSNLFNTIVPSKGTFTITIASPAVVTLNSHGLNADDAVYLTTTGALPTGLSVNTIYYVKSPTTNTFNLASTRGGSAINTSGSQSGTHTLYFCPYGLGNGSTTFNVPDLRGKVPVGLDNLGGTDAGNLTISNALGLTGGEENHTLTIAELPSHNHDPSDPTHSHTVMTGATAYNNNAINGGSNAAAVGITGTNFSGITLQNAGGGGSHNNLQPYIFTIYAIKT